MGDPATAQLQKRFTQANRPKACRAERRLMVAILTRVMDDLKLSFLHTVDHLRTYHSGRSQPSMSPISQLICDESLEWIMSDSRSDLGFLHICDELDLDVPIVRRKAVEIYKSNWRLEAERAQTRRSLESRLERLQGVALL